MISVEIAWLSPSGLAVRKEREMPRAVASELGASGGLSFEAGRAESPLRHPQPRRADPPPIKEPVLPAQWTKVTGAAASRSDCSVVKNTNTQT